MKPLHSNSVKILISNLGYVRFQNFEVGASEEMENYSGRVLRE